MTHKVWVGIDMSLSSPGVALRWDDAPTVHVWGVQQKKSQLVQTDLDVGKVRLTVVPSCPNENRWARSHYLVESIVQWVQRHVEAREQHGTVHVFIENYALGMVGSSSVSKLCELGGVLRHALWGKGWSFSELAPTTVKKHFACHGRADKTEMAQAYVRRGFPALTGSLGPAAQHPYEDIIDAVAILYTGEYLQNHPECLAPPKKKKLKRLEQ